MDELMQLADTVVYGRVAEVKSGWNDRRTVIYTTVTIAVDRTVKGRPSSTLAFQHVGGQVGNLRTRVSHFPEFSVGEDVLLFLNFARAGRISPLIRGGQGKYLVHRDEKTQTSYLSADSVKMPIFSATTRRPIAPERLQASGRVALDDVLYSLQRVMSSDRANRQRGE